MGYLYTALGGFLFGVVLSLGHHCPFGLAIALVVIATVLASRGFVLLIRGARDA